jgi:hypothetical protein
MMTQSTLQRPIRKGIIFGAIGGFAGGLVMYAVMSGVMQAIGMGANCFAVILALISGQPFSNNLVPLGLGIHLITSAVIGIIFGVVISSIKKLRIKGFARGIGFGVATGLIAFVIIFLPIAMIAMPPKIMDLMKMMNSQTTMMTKTSGAKNGGSSEMMSSGNNGMSEKPTTSGNVGMNGKSGMTSGSSSSSNSEMSGQMMMPDMAKMQSMIIGGSLLSHIVYGAVLGAVVTILVMKASGIPVAKKL